MNCIKNNKIIFIAITLVLAFIINVSGVNAEECDDSEYACAICTYHSDYFKTDITYTIKSDGNYVTLTRDKNEFVKQAEDAFHVSIKYTITKDYIAGNNFIIGNNNSDKKVQCFSSIKLYNVPSSNNIEISFDSQTGKDAMLTNQSNNNKLVFNSNSNTISCTLPVYNVAAMGYNNNGTVTLVSDGSKFLSTSFSNQSLSFDPSKNYQKEAEKFNQENGCPSLYVTCKSNLCEISDDGIKGWNIEGKETKEYLEIDPNADYQCLYKGQMNGKYLQINKYSDKWTIVYNDNKPIEVLTNKVENNIFPDITCQDVFFSPSNKNQTIKAVDASNKYFDTYIAQFCHMDADLEQFCDVNTGCKITKPSCGSNNTTEVEGNCPKILRLPIIFIKRVVFNTLQIFVPIILIVMGIFDMVRATISSEEKMMGDYVSKFIKRIITAILFFFITTIVSVVISTVAKTDVGNKDGWKACWQDID